uniref:Uncharacterized protein n=1 Tax=Tanacetum cinerariifolium TaxID=118510 RepID=A0A6L2P0T8_TANCI|nr:hypothetical protein [Tanacetum cinerariifolium]
MNPQETQQVAAHDENWVPSAKRLFWYTIKKVQDTDSYEFLLANKKCTINAEVFKTILDICLRVEGVDFTDVPNDDTTLTFLIDLGYKGLLNRGKGSKGRKIVDDSQEIVGVSIESKPEPVKKKTASRRVVKNKVTMGPLTPTDLYLLYEYKRFSILG